MAIYLKTATHYLEWVTQDETDVAAAPKSMGERNRAKDAKVRRRFGRHESKNTMRARRIQRTHSRARLLRESAPTHDRHAVGLLIPPPTTAPFLVRAATTAVTPEAAEGREEGEAA